MASSRPCHSLLRSLPRQLARARVGGRNRGTRLRPGGSAACRDRSKTLCYETQTDSETRSRLTEALIAASCAAARNCLTAGPQYSALCAQHSVPRLTELGFCSLWAATLPPAPPAPVHSLYSSESDPLARAR